VEADHVPGAPCQPDRQNGSWIVQANEWGKYLGRADFQYRNGTFTLVKYALIPINLKKTVPTVDGGTTAVTYTAPIAENPEMLALLKPYQEFGQRELSVAVGSSDAKLDGDRSGVRKAATNLGILIGQAMAEKTHSDFAVVNSGGIRDSLPAGAITYKDILKVQPFGNTLTTLKLTGSEVVNYLNIAAGMSQGAGGFPHFFGLDLVVTGGKVGQVRIKGLPLDPAKTYQMAFNSFMAVGGDGYPNVTANANYVNTGYVDAEVLRDFFAANSPVQSARFAPGSHVIYRAPQ
jgi:5'-nucleotidase/UDP-sugar diphosphatase